MTDFSIPQRMSVSALILIFLRTVKKILGFVILVAILKGIGSKIDFFSMTDLLKIFGVFAGCIIFSLLAALADYWPKKFFVKDGNLVFTHGILKRETTTIPLSRIHTLRTKQGLLYRLLGMRGISFDTLASKTAEIELILDERDWKSLLGRIEEEEKTQGQPEQETNEATGTYHGLEKEEEKTQTESTMRFKNLSLIYDAFCQNHLKGATVLFSFIAVIFNSANDIDDNATDKIADYASSWADNILSSPWNILILVAAVYLTVLALWLGKVFLRYADMSLVYDSKLLTFSHGLLTRATTRFAFNKVCSIRSKRNILEKRFGLGTLMLRQASNVSAEKEEDNLKLYGEDTSDFFLRWWLGEDYAASNERIHARSGRGAFFHKFIPNLLLCAVAASLLCLNGLYTWNILTAAWLAVAIAGSVMTQRQSHISLRDNYMIVSDGCFAERFNYIKYINVEAVRIRRTPFTRFFHRVSLELATAGTAFTVRSLKEKEAATIYELILDTPLSDESQNQSVTVDSDTQTQLP